MRTRSLTMGSQGDRAVGSDVETVSTAPWVLWVGECARLLVGEMSGQRDVSWRLCLQRRFEKWVVLLDQVCRVCRVCLHRSSVLGSLFVQIRMLVHDLLLNPFFSLILHLHFQMCFQVPAMVHLISMPPLSASVPEPERVGVRRAMLPAVEETRVSHRIWLLTRSSLYHCSSKLWRGSSTEPCLSLHPIQPFFVSKSQ